MAGGLTAPASIKPCFYKAFSFYGNILKVKNFKKNIKILHKMVMKMHKFYTPFKTYFKYRYTAGIASTKI